jgi:amino acid transporter
MQFDILDPAPFEAIGRQSLLLALVFIGGITLSLLFTFQDANLSSPEFWLVNLLFIAFIILIFFLSMRPTHELLAAEKKRQLDPVQRHINHACQVLVQRLEQDQEPGEISSNINALEIYEQRLIAARTWPYNTSMLRTLFFSVLIPLGSILVRLAVDFLLP